MSNAIDRAWEFYGVRVRPIHFRFWRNLVRNESKWAFFLGDVACNNSTAFEPLRNFAVFDSGRWIAITVNPGAYVVNVLPEHAMTLHRKALAMRRWEIKQAERSFAG